MFTWSVAHGLPGFGPIVAIRWVSSRVRAIRPLKHIAHSSAPGVRPIYTAPTSDSINRADGQNFFSKSTTLALVKNLLSPLNDVWPSQKFPRPLIPHIQSQGK